MLVESDGSCDARDASSNTYYPQTSSIIVDGPAVNSRREVFVTELTWIDHDAGGGNTEAGVYKVYSALTHITVRESSYARDYEEEDVVCKNDYLALI